MADGSRPASEPPVLAVAVPEAASDASALAEANSRCETLRTQVGEIGYRLFEARRSLELWRRRALSAECRLAGGVPAPPPTGPDVAVEAGWLVALAAERKLTTAQAVEALLSLTDPGEPAVQ